MKNEKRDLLVFGYGLSVILAFIGMRLWLKHGNLFVPAVLGVFVVCFSWVTAQDYRKLKPVYLKWMSVVKVIGAVVSTVILTVIFYVVFGSAGIILRVLRKDLLGLRRVTGRETYWQPCEKKTSAKERYQKQY